MTLSQIREWAAHHHHLGARAHINTLCDALEGALEVIRAKHPVEAERLAMLAKLDAPSSVFVVFELETDPAPGQEPEYRGLAVYRTNEAAQQAVREIERGLADDGQDDRWMVVLREVEVQG